jgi:hypothetical protein
MLRNVLQPLIYSLFFIVLIARTVGPEKKHWFPWGCPPLEPLISKTLQSNDVEAKKTAMSIIVLFKEGMSEKKNEKKECESDEKKSNTEKETNT